GGRPLRSPGAGGGPAPLIPKATSVQMAAWGATVKVAPTSSPFVGWAAIGPSEAGCQGRYAGLERWFRLVQPERGVVPVPVALPDLAAADAGPVQREGVGAAGKRHVVHLRRLVALDV